MQTPNELFTIDIFSTLAGLVVLNYIVITAMRQMFPALPHKWVAFVTSFLSVAAAFYLAGDFTASALILIIPNALLVFLSSAGVSTVVAETGRRFSSQVGITAATDPLWWHPW